MQFTAAVSWKGPLNEYVTTAAGKTKRLLEYFS
jgi:hypothetical protein